MHTNLFRREVIKAQQQNRQTGEILLAQSVPLWLVTLFILSIITIALLFLIFGEFTRKERVYGLTVPGHGAIRLTAQEAGFVQTMPFTEGQLVNEGDVLFEIRQERFSDIGDTRQLIETILESQSKKLTNEIKNRSEQEKINLRNIQLREDRVTQELASLDSEIELQKRQLASTRRMLKKLKPLFEDRIIPEIQYQQQITTHLDQQARLENLKRSHIAMKAELANIQQEMSASKLRAAAERSALERNRLTNEQMRVEQRGARVRRILAPMSGTISNILVDVGLPVEPGAPIATILPNGVQLEAQLFVPSDAVGLLAKGQKVKIRYDAFPYQKFGLYEGVLSELANIDVPIHEIQTRLPHLATQYQGKTFFKASIRLDSQTVQGYGKAIPLRAGLTLEADVLLERKRLIEWIFDPLLALQKQL